MVKFIPDVFRIFEIGIWILFEFWDLGFVICDLNRILVSNGLGTDNMSAPAEGGEY